ncbi:MULTISPECIES: MATE family efflux transporter [unclassified Gemella]|uniref:MATE family efflux transporter n=1 Tax=unclassified Gemella TaxID=2624949 RepID=UPI001C043D3C|nr:MULTISPECIES: MATE family efflux transporter [unclassified Gemella]MBU0278096.1 MATE family efflux transporter [Gemella sp. zg-1178]QWQ38378.1 MATE family efflux transporter [Gemella sp. zg-570]
MYEGKNTKEQIIIFIKLLFPVLIYQMISYSSNMIGTFMAGHYSSKDLAGISMGVNIWNPIFSVISTLVVAIVPIVSHLVGKGRESEIPTKLRQFIYIALIISTVIAVILNLFSEVLVDKLGISSEISGITKNFLKYQSYGLIPITLYVTLRSFIDSLGLTRISMIMMFIYVPVNILLSYALIFGKFGFYEFGGVGIAISVNITYIFSLFLAIFIILNHPKIKKYNIFKIEKIKFKHWPEIFKLGLPMSLAVLLETFMFSALSIMISIFDTYTIAAHQSSLNFAGFLYSLPMSISSALTIVVSYHLGAKNYKLANKYVNIGTLVSIIFSVITAVLILIFRSKIPYLYGSDESFVIIAKDLLIFVVGFVIFDSFSASLVGVLRAYKKVLPTCFSQIVGFYIFALPLAYYLVYIKKIGVSGLWISWVLGLGIYSILMTSYYVKFLRNKYTR